MNKIESFKINHDILEPGFYISRKDGDVITYDLRTRKPNSGDYMDNLTMHSVEHMFATIVRNSYCSDSVIYFGPMGCQTGFYLLVRDIISPKIVFMMTKIILASIVDDEQEMYGASSIECGNYKNLDLDAAKVECKRYLEILNENKVMNFDYPEGN